MTPHSAILRRRTRQPARCLLLAACAAFGSGSLAQASNKYSAAPAISAPRMGGGMGGGIHMPGNFGRGAPHIPGSMGSPAVHIPGSMAGTGVHLPSSMAGGGPHLPGNMAGQAHLPGGRTAAAPHTLYRDAAPAHGLHAAGSLPHAGPVTAAHAREDHRQVAERSAGLAHDGGEARHDHPHGEVPGGLHDGAHDFVRAAPHAAPAFMHADAHRDIAAEHNFIASHAHDFHARYVRDFSFRERARWREGGWREGWHYGRRGWWWNVDGAWYPYADPVFPYPLEVVEPVVYQTAVVDGPDPLPPGMAGADGGDPPPSADGAVPPGGPYAANDRNIPLLPAAPQVRYSCADPAGTYPDVPQCNAPWQVAQGDPPPPN
jgi:hypothetical protein